MKYHEVSLGYARAWLEHALLVYTLGMLGGPLYGHSQRAVFVWPFNWLLRVNFLTYHKTGGEKV